MFPGDMDAPAGVKIACTQIKQDTISWEPWDDMDHLEFEQKNLELSIVSTFHKVLFEIT